MKTPRKLLICVLLMLLCGCTNVDDGDAIASSNPSSSQPTVQSSGQPVTQSSDSAPVPSSSEPSQSILHYEVDEEDEDPFDLLKFVLETKETEPEKIVVELLTGFYSQYISEDIEPRFRLEKYKVSEVELLHHDEDGYLFAVTYEMISHLPFETAPRFVPSNGEIIADNHAVDMFIMCRMKAMTDTTYSIVEVGTLLL